MSEEKLLAARDLLVATKRTLQLLDEEIDKVKEGRIAVETAKDVSSEHRVAWFGATDDNDHQNGIVFFSYDPATNLGSPTGFDNPYRGTIRTQEDAAFVCTRVMVAIRGTPSSINIGYVRDAGGLFLEQDNTILSVPMIRLIDGNTGRNLTPGLTTGPFDRDRGAIPVSFLSSIRPGLGSNFKNSHFSEFTIPRASTVRVEVYNLAPRINTDLFTPPPPDRLYVSLFGYKVYGA